MNTITDHLGLVWTRSEDGKTLNCENGAVVIGIPEMTNEYLLSVAYLTE
jgi:hypothetical protein